MFPLSTSQGPQGFDPVVLLLALLVDAVIGDLPRALRLVPHPMTVIAKLTAALDDRFNRESRSQADRAIRGVLVVLVLAGIAWALGFAVSWLAGFFLYGWALELVVVLALLSQRGPFDRMRLLARALRAGDLSNARLILDRIVPFDPAGLAGHAIARAGVEASVEHFAARVVGPVFWYLLLGLPGMAAYMTVNRMASVIGAGSWRYAAFGLTSARLNDALGFFPAQLAGLYLVLAAFFVPTAKPLQALAVMLRDSGKHYSLNDGWPDGAAAGALDFALLGPDARAGWGGAGVWIGNGRTQVTPVDLHRTLYLSGVACLMNASVVVALALIRLTY